VRYTGTANAWPHPYGVGHYAHYSATNPTTTVPAIGMPPWSREGNIPTSSASAAPLRFGKQFVDTAPVKADDDLVADDDGRGAAALVRPNQLLQRRGVLRDVALDKVDPFLRKILFRRMAGASTVGGVDFDRLVGHITSPPREAKVAWPQ
jgi:hypothetical protein